MKDSMYTLFFSAMLGVVCASALTLVGEGTKDRYRQNQRADQSRRILVALEPQYDPATLSAKVLTDFADMIPAGEEKMGDLTDYRYVKANEFEAMAVKFEGQGLWGPIEGYLVLESDLCTIRGLAITRQEETPGLGAEITGEDFRSRWKGKRIFSPDGTAGIVVTKPGQASADNEIDGITGATLTSKAVEAMVNKAIQAVVKEAGKRE